MGEISKRNREYKNYGVSGAKKKLYMSSKTKQDGFMEVTNMHGTFYHRYVDGLSGFITRIAIYDSEFGQQLKILLDYGGDYLMSIGLNTGSQPFKAFINSCFNVDFSKNVTIEFFENKYNEKSYQGCKIRYDNKVQVEGKEIYESPKWLEKEDMPKPVERSNGKLSYEMQDDWYFGKAKELIQRIEFEKEANANA